MHHDCQLSTRPSRFSLAMKRPAILLAFVVFIAVVFIAVSPTSAQLSPPSTSPYIPPRAVVVVGWGGGGTRAVARMLDVSGVFVATGSGDEKCPSRPSFPPDAGDLPCVRGANDADSACSDTHLGE